MQPQPECFTPRLSLRLQDPHDLGFHGHARFCLRRIMTETRNVLSKSLVECQTAGNTLVSEDSTRLLKAHTACRHRCSPVLRLPLSDVFVLVLSPKWSLYVFPAQPGCCCLFPGHRKRPARVFFFPPCILRIAALCCGGADNGCGNVPPSWGTPQLEVHNSGVRGVCEG